MGAGDECYGDSTRLAMLLARVDMMVNIIRLGFNIWVQEWLALVITGKI
jgi:hypothetical protein